MPDIDRTQSDGVPTSMVSKYQDMNDGTHALVVAVKQPLTSDAVEVISGVGAEDSWSTLLNDVVIDGTPAAVNSNSHNIGDTNALWVMLYVLSTGAPTDVRIIPQFSHNNGANWFDFVEGLWASLYYEDTATATPGIRHSFLLPSGGQDLVRFRVVTTGAAAGNTFTVGIRTRAFRGAPIGAHA